MCYHLFMKNIFLSLKENILANKYYIIKCILGFVGVVLVILLSGAGITSFGMTSKSKIILFGLAFIYFASLYFLRLKTEIFREALEKKKVPIPRPFSIAIAFLLLLVLFSFIFNADKSANLNSYIAFVLMIVLTFFILATFEANFILNVFKNTIFVLSVISIFIFLLTTISKTFYSTIYFSSSKLIYGSHLFFTNDTISGLTSSYHFKLRMTSVFWEPSVFGTMIIFALIAEIFSKKDKLTLIRVIVIIFAAILSKSTAVYLLLPFVFLLFVTQKAHNYYLKATAVFLFVISMIVMFAFEKEVTGALANWLPDVFGKLTSKTSASLVTRVKSFEYCLRVFAKNPVFGLGAVTAREEYFAIVGGLVDAETSTFGSALAAYGFGGIIYFVSIIAGIVFCKKIDSFSKIVLVILTVLLSSVQNQNEILIANVFYLMPLSLTPLPKKLEERNKALFPISSISTKTVKDFILFKNDSGEVSRNVIGSLLLKGVAILIAFFTIPVYLKYFNNSDSTYGIWVAITSILSVITVFDFGMGNGLKNKLIKNIANKDNELSKTYVSTTYAITAIVGLLVFAIFTTLIFTLSDQVLLTVFYNGQDPATVDLLSFRIGVTIILLAIGCQFFMKNINYVLQAHQKNAVTGIFMVITNGCLMIFALIFANVIPIQYKIVSLAIAYFFFLIIPLLLASILLYSTKYKHLRPSFKSICFTKSSEIVNTSFKFFIVQIGNLFLWSLNEFIILFAFNFQSAMVTEYTEYYKLYSLLPIILGTVIQQPLWTAIAKAEVESNKANIKKHITFLMIATTGVVLFNMILSIALPLVFNIWLGDSAPVVSTSKIIAFVVYSIVYPISLMFVIIMNALSLFKSQITSSIMAIATKIPLMVLITFLPMLNFGWEVVMYINVLCYLPIFIFGPFEIYSFLKNKNLLWRRNHEEKV